MGPVTDKGYCEDGQHPPSHRLQKCQWWLEHVLIHKQCGSEAEGQPHSSHPRARCSVLPTAHGRGFKCSLKANLSLKAQQAAELPEEGEA